MTLMEILLIGILIAMGIGILIIQYELLCIAKYLDDLIGSVRGWLYMIYKQRKEECSEQFRKKSMGK